MLVVEVEAQVQGGVVGACLRLVLVDGVPGVVARESRRIASYVAAVEQHRVWGELFPWLQCGAEAVFSLGGDLE